MKSAREQWRGMRRVCEVSASLFATCRHPLSRVRATSLHVSTGSRTYPWLYSGIPSGFNGKNLMAPGGLVDLTVDAVLELTVILGAIKGSLRFADESIVVNLPYLIPAYSNAHS